MVVKKLRRAKKAVLGVLTEATTLVVMLAPDASDEYKAGVGLVGTIFAGLIIYYSTNEP